MPLSDDNVWTDPRWNRLTMWAIRYAPMGPYEPKHLFGRIPTFWEAWTGVIDPKRSVYDLVLASRWEKPKWWVSLANMVYGYFIVSTAFTSAAFTLVGVGYFLNYFVQYVKQSP